MQYCIPISSPGNSDSFIIISPKHASRETALRWVEKHIPLNKTPLYTCKKKKTCFMNFTPKRLSSAAQVLFEKGAQVFWFDICNCCMPRSWNKKTKVQDYHVYTLKINSVFSSVKTVDSLPHFLPWTPQNLVSSTRLPLYCELPRSTHSNSSTSRHWIADLV